MGNKPLPTLRLDQIASLTLANGAPTQYLLQSLTALEKGYPNFVNIVDTGFGRCAMFRDNNPDFKGDRAKQFLLINLQNGAHIYLSPSGLAANNIRLPR
jgi:hypothetical protein